jgi:hypothetical protein
LLTTALLEQSGRPEFSGFADKGGRDVHRRAAESNIVRFPVPRSSTRQLPVEEEMMDAEQRMPFRTCLAIWTLLAAAGWSAIGMAAHLI